MSQAAQLLTTQFTATQETANMYLRLSGAMTLADIEKLVIVETLRCRNNNRTHAAKALGIGIRTLQRKLKQYGI